MKIWHSSRTPERRRQTDSQHLEVIQGGINICLRSDISVRSDGNLAWPFHLFMLWFLIQYLVKGIVNPQMKTLASFTRPCHSKHSFRPYFLLWNTKEYLKKYFHTLKKVVQRSRLWDNIQYNNVFYTASAPRVSQGSCVSGRVHQAITFKHSTAPPVV